MTSANAIVYNQPTVIDIRSLREDVIRTEHQQYEKVTDSNYTSRGVRKSTKADPIRDPQDIKRIAEYLKNNGCTKEIGLRNRMAFVIGITTGLRVSDILKLRVEDVLNADGTFVNYITVREKKTRKTNSPKLTDKAKEAIREYLEVRGEFEPKSYLIAGGKSADGRLSEVQLYRILSGCMKGLKLDYHVSTHTMRKTYGYWAIRNHQNDPLAIVHLQNMFNHSSVNTTLTYCGLTRDEEEKYYDDMADML